MNNKEPKPFLYISKDQERSITLFYHFLQFKEIPVSRDMLDEFYDWVIEKREEKKMLDDMDGLELK